MFCAEGNLGLNFTGKWSGLTKTAQETRYSMEIAVFSPDVRKPIEQERQARPVDGRHGRLCMDTIQFRLLLDIETKKVHCLSLNLSIFFPSTYSSVQ